MTKDELTNDEEYTEIVEDMRDECGKYGQVKFTDLRIVDTALRPPATRPCRRSTLAVQICIRTVKQEALHLTMACISCSTCIRFPALRAAFCIAAGAECGHPAAGAGRRARPARRRQGDRLDLGMGSCCLCGHSPPA